MFLVRSTYTLVPGLTARESNDRVVCVFMTIGTVILAIFVFGLLIFIHELGHFLSAKWSGVKVNEFALGMGPVLFRYQGEETQYALRLFPIGGFVAMEGEDENSWDGRAFCNAALYKRIIIIIAGAVMNIALGFILLVYLSTQQPLFGTTTVALFEDNSVTNQWLKVEDEITHINGHRIRTSNDMIYELTRDRDGIMDFTVVREGKAQTLRDVAFQMDDVEGIGVIHLDFKVVGVPPTFTGTIRHSINWTGSVVKQVWGGLVDFVTGRYGFNQMSGPVGITREIGKIAADSPGNYKQLLLMVAFITINLGVFNLLPIPALDGGKLLFLLLELIRRRPVEARYEGFVHAAGFVMLIGLMIAVTFNDIMKLF